MRTRPPHLRSSPPFGGPFGWIEQLGFAGRILWRCLRHYGALLRGHERFDVPAFAAALHQSGLSILPALTLVSVAVGLILGRQTEVVLEQFDLPSLVLLSLAYTIVMEAIPLLVGVLVAGRAGVALTVRQASLAVSGELDGLLLCGIDPIPFTLGPVLLAMILMSCALAIWSALVAFAAAFLWLWSAATIPIALFLDALTRALTPTDLLEALLKPMIFALLIALIATTNGMKAGRDPRGVAQAATRTMIGAVTAILTTDLLYILFRPH